MKLILLLLMVCCCVPALSAAEEVELSSTLKRAESTYAQQVDEAVEKARRDIENSKARLLKVLSRELKTAEKKEQLDLVLIIQERIAVLEEREVPASLFGDTFVSPEAVEQGTLVLGDDLDQYSWVGGQPLKNEANKHEGLHSFIPTGNNYFPLLEKRVIGDEPGQVRVISFFVYLEKKESGLNFQANINGSWNYRTGIDGRAVYSAGYNWPRKNNIVNVATKEWVKIEIDLIEDYGAVQGDIVNHLAFSGQDQTLSYDNVQFHEHR